MTRRIPLPARSPAAPAAPSPAAPAATLALCVCAAASLALCACVTGRAGVGGPQDPREALAPPPPVPGLSEASRTVYAALFRMKGRDGASAARTFAGEPDLLRPFTLSYRWEGEAR
ncbi:MAG: hypothetical protein LBT40_12735, partial [Deltaproteobacteria bacterium]|nr:hypothetical protein [Deltaproteobacteria bacterium]